MRKLCVTIFLLALMITCLTACRRDQKIFGSFYSDEYLTEMQLKDIPVPGDLSDSVLMPENVFYINLTGNQYTKYVADVLAYLRERDEVYYLGQIAATALEAEMFPYDIIAPITENYKIDTGDHTFVFSNDPNLDGRDHMRLIDEIRIEFIRGAYTVSDGAKRLAYNTAIVITGVSSASQWNICYLEHNYDTGKSYDVPGTEQKVTIYTCVYCGHTEHDGFTGDNKTYNITVPETGDWHKLYNVPDSAPSGTLVRIFAGKIMDADLVVKVNGTKILCQDTEDQWCYEFIMPQENVVITADISGGA